MGSPAGEEKPIAPGPATPGAPGGPPAAKPEKKGLFGRSAGFGKKRGKKPKPAREKKARQPREKKVKTPREKKPKGAKKPLFSFGKKGPRQPRVKEPKAPKKKKARSGGIGGSKMSPVGLDLGRSSISAVRLRHQTGGSMILQAGLDTLPDGLIQEGEVKDVEALAFAIKEFWKANKIKGKKVSLGLANQKVVVRTLQFPLLDGKELRAAIEFQAQDYIPIPVEEAVFDFHILGRLTDEEGIERQKVLVVAAQKDMVMDYINAVKRARLQVESVDLQAFALLRALAPTSFLDQGTADRATAIANIASDVTNLVVDVAGEPQFTRIISFGGDDFTKSVQDLEGVSFIEAEETKARIGLSQQSLRVEEGTEGQRPAGPAPERPSAEGRRPEEPGPYPERTDIPYPEEPRRGEGMPESGPEEPTMIIPPEGAPPAGMEPEGSPPPEIPPMGAPGIGETPAETPAESAWGPFAPGEPDSEQERTTELQRALEITADALADEIRRSLDYYMSQDQSVPIGRLIISGGGAMLRNLDLHFNQVFPFPVEIGNPLLRITQNKSDLTDEELQALAPRLTIAIGLALEDED
ncbi:MAG: type IV pilus assembly protein PilM [Thermoleophilia bacterium]